MAIIKRDRKDVLTYQGVLVGMFLGGFLVYMICGGDGGSGIEPQESLLSRTEISSSVAGSGGTATTTKTKTKTMTTGDDDDDNKNDTTETNYPGWHTINVFYGEKRGLGADPNQKSYAQVHQDVTILDLFNEDSSSNNKKDDDGKEGGGGERQRYFIDLAANDALEFSNTLLLEQHGWDGLCIEPNPVYWYGLSHRKCTVVGALVGGPTMERVDVKFRGVFGGMVNTMDNKLANYKKEPDAKIEQRYTASIVQLFHQFHVPTVIDYMSLDVEGAEYLIMQHFPFDTYTMKFITIERPTKPLKQLLETHGYQHLKDFAWWGETLWTHESAGFTKNHPKIMKIQTEERK